MALKAAVKLVLKVELKAEWRSSLFMLNPTKFLNSYLQIPMIGGESGFVAPSMLNEVDNTIEEQVGAFNQPHKRVCSFELGSPS